MISKLRTTCPQVARSFSTLQAPHVEVDNLVVGAGVVGLAIAESLTRIRASDTTIIAEKNKYVGEETSSRNSEVIHAGIYYPPESLKTKLCIRGNRLLYELLSRTSIPYRRLGKWIVAQSPEQTKYLETLHDKAASLGVETYFCSEEDRLQQEPHIRAQSVLVSPSTGIIDSHALMDYLQQQIVHNGGDIALCTAVTNMRPASTMPGYLVELVTRSSSAYEEKTVVLAKRVFNAGGLHADKISNMLMPGRYKLHYAKGHYYTYRNPVSVNHLIYPCPEKNLAGLGTHLTLDMAGKIKFGPDVQYIDNPYDYNVPDEESMDKSCFTKAIQEYLPSINKDSLKPDYAGIRPKLAGPGEPFRDFIIKEEADSGHDNFFNLVGIESPGLTASLAIADYVGQLIKD
ncbi:hypothetical protein EC973_002480 [Apophysomyces ossiformis]|uniref:L-2-hydroxyglutarate dehydrogenase, mitochondrial n=1 Tax=Apophysomyces ossiformis TaxID=679940 RepID=A0A8H7BY87_9FUNG|nr:hypothetical protein EC973_002480 [Apophysomyces ossiformis]